MEFTWSNKNHKANPSYFFKLREREREINIKKIQLNIAANDCYVLLKNLILMASKPRKTSEFTASAQKKAANSNAR